MKRLIALPLLAAALPANAGPRQAAQRWLGRLDRLVKRFQRNFQSHYTRWSEMDFEQLAPHELMGVYRDMEERLREGRSELASARLEVDKSDIEGDLRIAELDAQELETLITRDNIITVKDDGQSGQGTDALATGCRGQIDIIQINRTGTNTADTIQT